jgi:multiple sugar transport system ATP-binding protein
LAEVRLTNVNKIYPGDVHVVRDANLEIQDGELVVLVGPSGCGKTTTLRMIAGLEETTQGDIFIGDRRVNGLKPRDRDIAMVFQNYALYPHLSVRDNLSFSLRMRRVARDEIERRVAQAAQILSIESLLERRPRALSGGQRQRVALGRAIVRQPQVFLFDEPLSNLDAKLRVQMRAEIARLHNRLKTTMIYVTHDQVEAMTLGNRIVVMNDGVIQQVDSPLGLYSRPVNRFVAGFIGSPAMNFLHGKIVGDQFQYADRTLPVDAKLPEGPAILGIRPEALQIECSATTLLDGTVDVVERMGHETIVYIQHAGEQVIARLGPDIPHTSGQPIALAAHSNSWHFFAATGEQQRLN